MDIDLNNGYSITTDSYNWVLKYAGEPYRKTHRGKEREVIPTDEWYFPNVSLCLKKYIDQSLKSCGSIEEILSKLEILNEEIDVIKIEVKANKEFI